LAAFLLHANSPTLGLASLDLGICEQAHANDFKIEKIRKNDKLEVRLCNS